MPITAKEMLAEANHRDLLVMKKLLQIRDARIKFAVDHHRNTRGEAMDFENFPHIRDIYTTLAPRMALQGSVQSFKSEWAVVDHFAMAMAGLSVFFVVPKFEARTTFVQNRINRCVEQVPEYKRIVRKGFFDNMSMKNFGSGVIKYVGSNVLSDFKEFPADIIYVDEVDECDSDNIEYALDRMKASRYQFIRYLGNPKLIGRGINMYFLRSDQREWEVPCPDCKRFSQLDWFETVVEAVKDKDGNILSYVLRDKEWIDGCRRDIFPICPDCGGRLPRNSRMGRWVPQNPGANMEGYHISLLCSPINTVASMWATFLQSLDDPQRLQQFYNSVLGLPFASHGNKVTDALLLRCADDDYKFQIEGNVGFVKGDRHEGACSMGVDVGGNFDVRVSFTEKGKRRALFIGKVSHLEDLYSLVDRYNVEKVVIDALPEITLVQDFQDGCASMDCDVWLCRYGGEGQGRRMSFQPHTRTIVVDRTSVLDRSFAQLRTGRNVLPANFDLLIGGQFAKEMCGPVRQLIEDAKGNGRYEWTKCADHQRHADTYDMIAAGVLAETTLEEISVG